jgi:hypothetical protein
VLRGVDGAIPRVRVGEILCPPMVLAFSYCAFLDQDGARPALDRSRSLVFGIQETPDSH